MSNPIIYNSLVREDEENPRLIDSNIVLEKKLTMLKQKQEKELRAKLNITGENGEEILDGDGNPVSAQAENVSGEAPSFSYEEAEALEAEAKEKAEEIVKKARDEASEILRKAAEQAEANKSNAREEGRSEGYQEGLIKAQEEVRQARDDYDTKVEALKKEYDDQRSTMEKELLDVIIEVVNKVFHCEFDGKKDILLYLCNDAISRNGDSKDFLVRVGHDSIEEFQARLPEIQAGAREGVSVSVTEDPLLSGDQCMIETDGGIIDCSLGTEMDNLMRDLKALTS